MIQNKDIKDILASVAVEWPAVEERDIVYLILCDTFADKSTAARLAYGREQKRSVAYDKGIKVLAATLSPFGIGVSSEDDVSREENKSALIKLLPRIKAAVDNGELDVRDGLKLETDIRVKLNDKFEMEADRGQKHLIVVPQKHDLICPHTNRECSKMPSKKACMEYYKLKE